MNAFQNCFLNGSLDRAQRINDWLQILFEYDGVNADEMVNTLCNESIIDLSSFRQFFRLIAKCIECRPTKTTVYITLLIKIAESIPGSQESIINQIKQLFINCDVPCGLHIVSHLRRHGILTSKNFHHVFQYTQGFVFDEQIAHKTIVMKLFDEKLSKAEANELEEEENNYMNCAYPNSLEDYIRHDMVNEFQNVLAINQQLPIPVLKYDYQIYCGVLNRGISLPEYVAYCGSEKCFEYLWTNYSDLFKDEELAKSVYKNAIKSGCRKIMDNFNFERMNSIFLFCHVAIEWHRMYYFYHFLDILENIKSPLDVLFLESVNFNNIEAVLYIIQKSQGLTKSVNIGIENDNPEMIDLLANYFDDIPQLDKHVSRVVRNDNYDALKVYIDTFPHHFDIVGTKQNYLFMALEKKHFECAKVLLNSSIDLNAEDDNKRTVLHHAAIAGDLDFLNLLLPKLKNFDINKKDLSKHTALHYAAKGSLEILKIILSIPGIQLNPRNCNEATPFLLAIQAHLIENVRYMIQIEKIDINFTDNFGFSPFHTACLAGDLEIVKILLDSPKLVKDNKTYSGKTPITLSICSRNNDLFLFLMEQEDLEKSELDYQYQAKLMQSK